MTKQQLNKQQEVFPARRVWVVAESQLAVQEPKPEVFGYNDWDIYHGA